MNFLNIKEAEKLAGVRLDRRRKYFVYQDNVCFLGWYTTSCSGCFEGGEYGGLAHNYPWDAKAGCSVGGGCDECGYTGKRRLSFPIPHNFKDYED